LIKGKKLCAFFWNDAKASSRRKEEEEEEREKGCDPKGKFSEFELKKCSF
jgi:hypothetical protein